MIEEEVRQLHLRGALGAVRTESYEGREHLVVPVVALMEGVIHAVNASTPEFVSLATLTKAAASWNGRPVVLGHPTKDGRQCSANTPAVLATHGIGTIFNARVEGKKLLCEAWVDKARAEKLDAAMWERLLAGTVEEVSVGAFVVTDGIAGDHLGKPYKASWLETTGDHLALLPGKRGACSVEMGCGTHRAAMHLVTAEGLETLGAQDGHPFYGNQYTDGSGGEFSVKSESGTHLVLDKTGKEVAKFQLPDDAHQAAKDLATGSDALRQNLEDLKSGKKTYAEWKSSRAKGERPKKLSRKGMLREDAERVKQGKEPIHKEALNKLYKGSIRKRVPTLREASELRVAECPHLDTISTMLDEVFTLHEEAADYVEDLREAEEAGAEVDVAQLEAVETLAMQMGSMLSSVISLTYKKRAPSLPELAATNSSDYPRYMAAFRAAIGKEISAKNAAVIQATHDSTHSMHDHATALGAVCDREWKWLAGKDCVVCDGTGQIKTDDKQQDCTACDGTGVLKTAETANVSLIQAEKQLRAACRCEEESTMTKEQKAVLIAALVNDKYSGFKEGDVAFLETATDARLEEFKAAAETIKTAAETATKQENDLRAATAKLTVIEGKLKAAEAAPTAEQWLAVAPPEIRTLLENQKAQEAELREDLVKQLKAAGANTEEELKAMPTAQLQTLAKYAKVQTPDFSGRGIPQQRAAADGDDEDYTPPDPYEASLKALKGQAVN